MTKKTNNLIWKIVITAIIGLVIGYFFGVSSAVPDYVKTGVVTLVFTMPSSATTENGMVKDCIDAAKGNLIFGTDVTCEAESSKYFQGEVDCVCSVWS